eukprot:CAMPEP_0184689364 /NCGR_PEP_ID=MMETSP0312-20130426/30614_1 /TAXON_ID=31354 /ORGANISM="Compsopogon coeruleus, Strain SAG 36.94" /LENGTH=596 /DNA_ID=CAMNT_0027146703 /DNA_START=82 /DNA_END=1872 /DNA_ORIENTATION=-
MTVVMKKKKKWEEVDPEEELFQSLTGESIEKRRLEVLRTGTVRPLKGGEKAENGGMEAPKEEWRMEDGDNGYEMDGQREDGAEEMMNVEGVDGKPVQEGITEELKLGGAEVPGDGQGRNEEGTGVGDEGEEELGNLMDENETEERESFRVRRRRYGRRFGESNVVEETGAPTDRSKYYLQAMDQKRRRPRVGIIGGGISGLMCANRLMLLGGVDVTVWDRGRVFAGGRASSRVMDRGRFIFDHGTQFFTASDPRFQRIAEAWCKFGIAKRWTAWDEGRVGVLSRGNFHPLPDNDTVAYIGVPTMGEIARHLSLRQKIKHPKIVVRMAKREGQWDIWTGRGPKVATYDSIVLAHSGRSAVKLTTSSGVPNIRKLLDNAIVQAPDEEQELQECSLWTTMVAFKREIPVPFEAAFVRQSRVLSWVCNNTKKMGIPFDGVECWTLISTRAFALRNKAAPEGTPRHVAERVTDDLLREFEDMAGLEEGSLKPIYYRAQLWLNAVPLNTLDGVEYVFDAENRVGLCGDWIVDPSIEGAVLSGLSLANKLHEVLVNGEETGSVGLDAKYQPLDKLSPLGHIHGLDASELGGNLIKTAIRGRMM